MSVRTEIHQDSKLIETARDLALEGYGGPGKLHSNVQPKYEWLKEVGSKLWLDTGDGDEAEHVWAPEVDALTTNNTLVNQVVQTGAMDGIIAYGARKIREVRPDISERELVIEIAFLVNARLALSLVERFGAHVSVELHPDLSWSVGDTLTFAKRYYRIKPDHFYVKIPLTPDGFVATRILSMEGIPVNFTLGFSARQNYLAARFAHPRFVNVFLGRLNQLVEQNDLGKPENVGEKATLASCEAIRELRRSQIGIFTEQIGASIRSGRQIAKLAGVDVLTMPPKAAAEYLDLDIPRHDLRLHNSRELNVEINQDRLVEAGELTQLWEINGQFLAFAQDAARQGDSIASGRDLVKLSHRHDINLFYDWTEPEREELRMQGKIPDLSQWPGVPIDELMSMAALESFAKDQAELDNRIGGLIRQA